MTENFEKRVELEEERYEKKRPVQERRSEDFKVMEEVFDKPTLMTVYHLMNIGVLSGLSGVLNAGKEARVYKGSTLDGGEIAVKIYLTSSSEFKKGMSMYIEGDPRFARVKRGTRSLIYTWALKEYRNLVSACNVGVRVPKPIRVLNNVLVMEFIGEEGDPAPLLKERPPEDLAKTYKTLMRYVKTLYRKAELVHGDLSEYNIMILKGKPVIFDMAQAVSIVHPRSKEFLLRDLSNIERYFRSREIEVVDAYVAYKWVTGDVGDK